MMEAIFGGHHVELVSLQKQIDQTKDLFRSKCRRVMSEVHKEDWEELEVSLIKSLEDHFVYWDSVMKKIQDNSIEAFQQLDEEHDFCKVEYKEYLEKVLKLVPRDNRNILNYKKMEGVLLNLFK